MPNSWQPALQLTFISSDDKAVSDENNSFPPPTTPPFYTPAPPFGKGINNI